MAMASADDARSLAEYVGQATRLVPSCRFGNSMLFTVTSPVLLEEQVLALATVHRSQKEVIDDWNLFWTAF